MKNCTMSENDVNSKLSDSLNELIEIETDLKKLKIAMAIE